MTPTGNDHTTETARGGEIHARSDVGETRETNEDAVLATSLTDDSDLLAVADGMGGHQSGEIASATALSSFESALRAGLATDELDGDTDTPADSDCNRETLLRYAAAEANAELEAAAASGSSLDNMGTTLVAALLEGQTATLVNIGDSRAYHVSSDDVDQLTVDHSLVQELVESGTLTPAEARDHPQRNVITQSLGPGSEINPDTDTVDVGGTLLLCSDGLTEELSDGAIKEIVGAADDPATITERLVERANENGGSDNISVVVAVR
ncbi:Stp1/IreP family PP2C-type Ser/Thr phosphatase [Halobellus salinisoli]|uniref:Stp1/IreP family PP2C-type Ser/Thr phosphatase n=1 Tax=Halobellus salinisoli TaxID=3108500 RepID=UPI003008D56F